MDNISHIKRREILKSLIEEWNADRLDLFAITPPDEVSTSSTSGEAPQTTDLLLTVTVYHACSMLIIVIKIIALQLS